MNTESTIEVRPSNRHMYSNWSEYPAFVACVKSGKLILGVGFGNTEEEAKTAAVTDAEKGR